LKKVTIFTLFRMKSYFFGGFTVRNYNKSVRGKKNYATTIKRYWAERKSQKINRARSSCSLKFLEWNLILKNEISLLKIDDWVTFFNTDSFVTFCYSLKKLDSTPKILESGVWKKNRPADSSLEESREKFNVRRIFLSLKKTFRSRETRGKGLT